MRSEYLIRLDDACSTMHKQNWERIEKILDKHGVKPMVGIIPANADPAQMISEADTSFWQKVNAWRAKGWTIALHGYDHRYLSAHAGINPLWNRSEFAGLPLDVQRAKIRNGVQVLRNNGINPEYFFAPSHTFDLNTLEALRLESDIRILSDTIATKPYRAHGFTFIPQLGGACRKMPLPGVWTFCLHPSMMSNPDFDALDNFLSENADSFISFDALDLSNLKSKSLLGRLLSFAYFTMRRLKKVK